MKMNDLIERGVAYDEIGFERCGRSCKDCPTKCTWFFTVRNIPAANRCTPCDVYVVIGKDGKYLDIFDNFKSAIGRGMAYLSDIIFDVPKNADVNNYVNAVVEDYDYLKGIYTDTTKHDDKPIYADTDEPEYAEQISNCMTPNTFVTILHRAL